MAVLGKSLIQLVFSGIHLSEGKEALFRKSNNFQEANINIIVGSSCFYIMVQKV